MNILTACCIILALAYAILLLLYRIGWSRQQRFVLPAGFAPATKVSVIIPARNEADNITACVRAVAMQDYPAALAEIIVVDDHSEDGTAALALDAGEGRARVISLQEWLAGRAVNAYKKEALAAGIAAGTGEVIVTTDADCVAGPRWLKSIAALYEQTQAAMIIAPVSFETKGREHELFQSLDFMMMQGITAAAHCLKLGGMANGANLAFSRSAYEAVGGYEGTTQLASGDDYLLLHKMRQAFPGRIQYLKSQEAIVRTAPQPGWYSFLQQRIRWASKSGRYSDHRLTLILALVYLFNLSLLALAIAAVWQPQQFRLLLVLLGLKAASELVLLWPVAGFFKKRRELFVFPFLQPLHVAYIVVAGLFGIKGGYAWKGRRVR
jgi:glycosyltransferase involved in cell wall biosynthesis